MIKLLTALIWIRLFAGFDVQQEKNVNKVISSFHTFIEENKDEIVALRIIYDAAYKERPMVIEKLKELYEKLKSRRDYR